MILISKDYGILMSDIFFHTFATSLAIIPSKLGGYLRVAFYKGVLGEISWDVNIGFGTFFSKRNVQLGNHVCIGAYCIIGAVQIDDNVSIASRVSIPSGRNQHSHDRDERVGEQSDGVFEVIKIGKNTWIGEGAIVMANIGTNCIIGAGSVVTRPVHDDDVVAGNPAKAIKTKSKNINGNCDKMDGT